MKQLYVYALCIFSMLILNKCALLEVAEISEAALIEEAAVLEAQGAFTADAIGSEFISTQSGTRFIVNNEAKLMNSSRNLVFNKISSNKTQVSLKGNNQTIGNIIEKTYLLSPKGQKIFFRNSYYRTTSNVVIRSGKAIQKDNIILKLEPGDLFQLIDTYENWYKIRVTKNEITFEGNIDINSPIELIIKGTNTSEKPVKKTAQTLINYPSLINSYINNLPQSKEITVIISDENLNFAMTLMSEISKIYRDSGLNSNFSLFKEGFLNTDGFQKLYSGNVTFASSVNLFKNTDYIAIGKIHSQLKDGTITQGTRTCKSYLEMHIIDVKTKMIIKAFTIDKNGIGFDDDQARYVSYDHIYTRYQIDYSKIE